MPLRKLIFGVRQYKCFFLSQGTSRLCSSFFRCLELCTSQLNFVWHLSQDEHEIRVPLVCRAISVRRTPIFENSDPGVHCVFYHSENYN